MCDVLLSMVWSFLVLWVASCLWCGRAEEKHSAGGARGVGRRRERAVVISVCVPHCVWRIIYTREKCKSNQKHAYVCGRVYAVRYNQFTLMANPSSSRASALERAREAAAAAAAARAAGAELAASRNMLVRVWRGADDLEMAGCGTAGCPATGRWGGG